MYTYICLSFCVCVLLLYNWMLHASTSTTKPTNKQINNQQKQIFIYIYIYGNIAYNISNPHIAWQNESTASDMTWDELWVVCCLHNATVDNLLGVSSSSRTNTIICACYYVTFIWRQNKQTTNKFTKIIRIRKIIKPRRPIRFEEDNNVIQKQKILHRSN